MLKFKKKICFWLYPSFHSLVACQPLPLCSYKLSIHRKEHIAYIKTILRTSKLVTLIQFELCNWCWNDLLQYVMFEFYLMRGAFISSKRLKLTFPMNLHLKLLHMYISYQTRYSDLVESSLCTEHFCFYHSTNWLSALAAIVGMFRSTVQHSKLFAGIKWLISHAVRWRRVQLWRGRGVLRVECKNIHIFFTRVQPCENFENLAFIYPRNIRILIEP